MLRGIHKASSTWLGKAVMAVDHGLPRHQLRDLGHRRHFPRDSAATPSPRSATPKFRSNNFASSTMTACSNWDVRSVDRSRPMRRAHCGLDRQILGQLIAETTLDEQAKRLRLGVSEADIAKRITDDPSFRGPSGQFDRSRFEQLIRAGRLHRKPICRRAASRVVAQANCPERQRRNESADDRERPPSISFGTKSARIEYVVLGPAQAGEIPPPTPEELGKYFEERKALFRAPEYRKVTLLRAVAGGYRQAGRGERRGRQDLFRAAQRRATARLKSANCGRSFSQCGRRCGRTRAHRQGRDLRRHRQGTRRKRHRYRARHGRRSRDHRPGDRRRGLRAQAGRSQRAGQRSVRHRAAAGRQDRAGRGEDLRAGRGADQKRDRRRPRQERNRQLCVTRSKMSALPARHWPRPPRNSVSRSTTIEAVDRSGRGPDGKPVAGPAARRPTSINAAFSSDVGVDTEALQLPNGGYLCYDVTGITPSRERTLDEVKDQVAARWRDDEIAKRLQTKADDMLGKLKAGTAFAQAATGSRPEGCRPRPTCSAASQAALCRRRSSMPFSVRQKARPALREGDKRDRAFRLSGDRRDRSRHSMPTRRKARRSMTRCRTPTPTTLSANIIARLENEFGVNVNPAGAEPGHRRRRANSNFDPCRSSRRKPPLPNAMGAAKRRWCGPRWSPTSKRRSRLF